MDESQERLPRGFLIGAGISAYQVEGGRAHSGPSIWTQFADAGKIRGGVTADVACDFYHRFREDIAHMGRLGLRAFRFSIAWPRVYPSGPDVLSEEGVAFYSQILDALAEHGIAAVVTLYHWDLPLWVQERGGWTNRNTVDLFVAYANNMFRVFGPRVTSWLTHNEPRVVAYRGFMDGSHPPCVRDPAQVLTVAHHLLLSHGRAVRAFRSCSHVKPGAQIGIALNLKPVYPSDEFNAAAVAHAAEVDVEKNRWFLDPLFGRGYPSTLPPKCTFSITAVQPGDMEDIAQRIDFVGVNCYSRTVVNADGSEVRPPAENSTTMGWEIAPRALGDLLVRIHRDYGCAILVTENGAAFDDDPKVRDGEGYIVDAKRVEFLRQHFAAVRSAMRDHGVRIVGYLVWSLLRNLEWTFGYAQDFGIFHVDFESLERVPKQSAKWLSTVCKLVDGTASPAK